MLKKHGIICIITLPLLYHEVRNNFQKKVDEIDVFVNTSPDICKNHDKKRTCTKTPNNEMKNSTVDNNTFESPVNPDLYLNTDRESPDESCQKVYNFLTTKGYIDEIESYLNSTVYNANRIERILSGFPFSSVRLLKNSLKKSIREGIYNTGIDCLQFLKLKQYKYKHRIIFIAGLPKSGTTWLQNILGMLPGYCVRYPYDPSRAPLFHDISPLSFDLLPDYAYSIVKLHTKYTPYNFKTIINKVSKFIILYRDLRDVCVSRYHHVINQKDHRHHSLYKKLGKKDALFHCINIVNNTYIDWVQQWYEIANNYHDNILQVRYEELNANLYETIKKILSFFSIPYDENLINKMVDTQLKKEVSLQHSLKKSDTKRKGSVGEWKNHFNKLHKEHFKKISGSLLIKLGYEKDFNW